MSAGGGAWMPWGQSLQQTGSCIVKASRIKNSGHRMWRCENIGMRGRMRGHTSTGLLTSSRKRKTVKRTSKLLAHVFLLGRIKPKIAKTIRFISNFDRGILVRYFVPVFMSSFSISRTRTVDFEE